jgi:Ser/Thr protein kinase RdoA (MazF antagonist)
MHASAEELDALRDEATAALAAWGAEPGGWRLVGAVSGGLGRELRPVVELDGQRYFLRRQPPNLSEDDAIFRQAFMRHLRAEGLPVPYLRQRPSGSAYALVAGDLYELQEWRAGEAYHPRDERAAADAAHAATTLGHLHQVAADFGGAPHQWPRERQPEPLAYAYLELLRQAGQRPEVSPAVAAAIERTATACEERIPDAARGLAVVPGPPELHLHGDYQPHNVAFAAGGVVAIYDFDAVHWGRRLDELAYALLCFCGLDDEPGSPPAALVDDGLDILRAHAFLSAYAAVAPPAEEEATRLGDALTLALPLLVVNGLAEDLVFADDFGGAPPEADVLPRLEWVDRFWLWLDRYREVLAEAWEVGAGESDQ